MNDYFKKKIESLIRKIEGLRNPHQRDQIRISIEETLDTIIDENDKNQIIELYNIELTKGLENHKKICSATNYNCVIEKSYETAFFFLKQESKKVELNQKSKFSNYIENLTINGNSNLLNLGNVNGNIEQNIKILNDSGENNIANAFKRLKDLVNNGDFPEDTKNLVLDNVNELSRQATLEKKDRLPINVLKSIFSGINVLSSISTVAGLDLQTIIEFFNQ